MSDKNIQGIIEALEKLSVVDALNLVKTCEEKWGVSAAAPVAVAAGGTAEAAAEKTEWEVLLTGAGDKKIDVMKQVRAITNKELLPAKEFVEKATDATPGSLGMFSKEKAEEIAAQLKAVGASVKVA